MTPDERQIRILGFIEAYQQQNGDAPTIREIVRGSGVSTLANIGGDIEVLTRRGLLAFVTEHVSGSEPFSSRQVKLVTPIRAAGPPGAAAQVAAPGPAPIGTGGAHGTSRPQGRTQQPMPADPGRSAARAPKSSRPAGRLSTWLERGSKTRAGNRSRNSLGERMPVRLAIGAAIVVTLLFIGARLEQSPLPTAPALQLGSRAIPLLLPGAILAWALSGLILGLAAERAGGWRWRPLAGAATIGLLAGLLGIGWERALRPLLAPIELSGLPRLLDGLIYILPAVLPAAFVRASGVAVAGIVAAELPKLILGQGYNYAFRNLAALPLVAMPVELVLLAQGQRQGRRGLMLAGAAAGLGQVAVSAAFAPGLHAPGMWPTVLVTALVGGLAAGWLAFPLRDRALQMARWMGISGTPGGRP